MLDIYLRLGYSYSYLINKFNPELIAQNKPRINMKDISLHKRICVIPSLSIGDLNDLAELGITLVNENFINPALSNKTLYRKDR